MALNRLLIKVSAHVKKPDFFSLAPPALAKDRCSLFVGSKRIRKALSKRIVEVATDIASTIKESASPFTSNSSTQKGNSFVGADLAFSTQQFRTLKYGSSLTSAEGAIKIILPKLARPSSQIFSPNGNLRTQGFQFHSSKWNVNTA